MPLDHGAHTAGPFVVRDPYRLERALGILLWTALFAVFLYFGN